VRGSLIVLEGGEGVGKSTQLRRLSARMTAAGVPHRVFREPGGTAAGDRIRDLLLHTEGPLAPATEAALFIASRAELVHTEVQPALARGEHVLLDRFMLSTYAYQVHGRGLPEADVRAANHLATGGLVPDLTLLLMLPADEGLRRAAARSANDRMERAEPEFHRRVAAAFERFSTPTWQFEHPECGPILPVNASADEDTVESRLHSWIRDRAPFLLPAEVRA